MMIKTFPWFHLFPADTVSFHAAINITSAVNLQLLPSQLLDMVISTQAAFAIIWPGNFYQTDSVGHEQLYLMYVRMDESYFCVFHNDVIARLPAFTIQTTL